MNKRSQPDEFFAAAAVTNHPYASRHSVSGSLRSKGGDSVKHPHTSQWPPPQLHDRLELSQAFYAFVSRNVPSTNGELLKWARRLTGQIQSGMLETDIIGIMRWIRAAKQSRHFRPDIIAFLQRSGALPGNLPDEDTFQRLVARRRVENVRWEWLAESDQALIREYLAWFMDRGNSEYSAQGYLSSVTWLDETMRRASIRQLAELRPGHIAELIRAFIHKGVTPQAYTRILSDLKTLFSWLRDEKGLAIQPVLKRHIPRHRMRVPRPLSAEELLTIRKALDEKFDGSTARALFYLIYATGLRISEAIAVRTGDIDHHSKQLFIPRGKGGDSAWLPIAGYALERIKECLASSPMPSNCDHVFHRNGFQISRINAYALRDLIIAASGVKFGWHQLRTTFATRLAEAKVGPFEIQRLMRHKYLDTIMRYIRYGDKHVRNAYIAFVEKLLSSGGQPTGLHVGTAIDLLNEPATSNSVARQYLTKAAQ